MPSPISLLGNLSIPEIRAPLPAGEAAGTAFGSVFRDSIATVEGLRQNAGQSVGRLLAGDGEDLHTAALAAQQAELSFDLFLQVRNKVVQAYQEVMRMQM
jgi:flagellar hook-basal body complex protein FliE